MAEGVFLRLAQVGPLPRQSILINDVSVGEGGMKEGGRGGFPRSGAVYVPTTGFVELVFTSSVALSYERGCIAGMVARGLISATFRVGTAFTDAVLRNRGWENYDDTASTLVPQVIPANAWTTIACDGIGAQTSTAYKPAFVSRLYDVPTQMIYLQDTRVGDYLTTRLNFYITPALNHSRLLIRLWFLAFGGFPLSNNLPRMDSGAGIPYQHTVEFSYYIGSNDVRLGGAYPQVYCTSAATLVNEGILVQME